MKPQITTRSAGITERRLLPQPDGSTLVQIQVDLSRLPSPDRSYAADQASVELSGDVLKFLFAQEEVGGKGLRSLLIVSLFPEAVRSFLSTLETFWPALHQVAERNGAADVASNLRPTAEPKSVVSLRANLIAASYSGREAEMQFFHLTPLSVHKSRGGQSGPDVDSVVRIDLSTAMLHSIVKTTMGTNLPEDWK